MQIAGKIAVVTGAGGGGCGRAIARRLSREGASVVVSDLREAAGRETVEQIRAETDDPRRAAFFRADVGVQAEVEALFAFAETTYGGVDLLVNNASHPEAGGPLEGWFETLQVDLLGAMYATLRAIEALRKRGGGAIVNIGSTSALGHGFQHSPWPGYDVAKMGVIRLTTALGCLRQSEGIRVNCLVPGWIASPQVVEYWVGLTPELRAQRGAPEVLLSLDEIADCVVRLATDESLGGRVMLLRNSQPPRLIAEGDPGYARLE
jgi:NAD(P)-dependent dehydrogenase (short-subunit alcohol dehydrogenase family)